MHHTTTPTDTSDRSVCRFGDMCRSARCPWCHPNHSGTNRQPQWEAGNDMQPPCQRTLAAVSAPAEEKTHSNAQGDHEVRALQQPPNAVHAERAIGKQAPPSLYEVPAHSTRAGAVPRAPRGACHGVGNRAVTSQPRTVQSTSYGDVKSTYRGGGRVGQEWVRKRGTQERQQTRGGATQTHRTREPHQEGRGRAQRARRRGAARQKRQPGQGTRMGGMGERAHGRQRQQRGWPGQPAPSLPGVRATPPQPASGGGLSPAAQMGCLRNRSRSPRGADQP